MNRSGFLNHDISEWGVWPRERAAQGSGVLASHSDILTVVWQVGNQNSDWIQIIVVSFRFHLSKPRLMRARQPAKDWQPVELFLPGLVRDWRKNKGSI